VLVARLRHLKGAGQIADDLLAHFRLTAAIGAAVGASMDHWLRADPSVSTGALIREAFDRLRGASGAVANNPPSL
jgi:hypothetical protein